MEAKADELLDKWFPSPSLIRPASREYAEYEII